MSNTNNGKFNNLAYNEKVFNYAMSQLQDPFLLTLINSGAVVRDSEIETQMANGSNTFRARYFPAALPDKDYTVYNGKNDVSFTTVGTGEYEWVSFTRMTGWESPDFDEEFTNTKVMNYIMSNIGKFQTKARQKTFLALLKGLFGITGNANWTKHTTDISIQTNTTPNTENKLSAATISQAITKACGDNSNGFSIVMMHSVVRQHLSQLNLLDYAKYTDPSGITSDINIETINGLPIIVNDNVPVDTTTTASAPKYTTYVLGTGVIGYGKGNVTHPLELTRDPVSKGGVNRVIVRLKEAFVPYGFNFKGDVTNTNGNKTPDVGVTDAELTKSENYELFEDAKLIKMVQIISN